MLKTVLVRGGRPVHVTNSTQTNTNTTNTMKEEIIKAVKDLAEKNYNLSYGWQVIVECMEDEEIWEHLEYMQACLPSFEITLESAIEEFTDFAALHTEQYSEIRSTVW
jgi:hypothetical protein